MFRAKTVLVLGAGASVEVGLPAGPELLEQIVKLTYITFELGRQKSGDEGILRALKLHLNEGGAVDLINEHLKAGWQLSDSAQQALSIDNVIDALEDPKVELIGKMGIAKAILRAEAASPLFKNKDLHPDTLDLSKFDKTWYSSLTKLLTENVRKTAVGGIFDNLEVINFNYDRCLENYLPFSIAKYYGLQLSETRELMQTLAIHRPYGRVGRLPWQLGEAPSVSFGSAPPEQIAEVAQQVRTFTERVEEGAELQAMRDAIANADRIIFLGFAFHRQNVELIAQHAQEHAHVLATAYKISESDKAVIEDELSSALDLTSVYVSPRVVLADMTCSQFFQEYWRTMTAERGYDRPAELPSAPRTPRFGLGE